MFTERKKLKKTRALGWVTATAIATIAMASATTSVDLVSAKEEAQIEWVANEVSEIREAILKLDKDDLYEIQWGDTLGAISLAAEVDIDDLAKVNGIEDIDFIMAGDELIINREVVKEMLKNNLYLNTKDAKVKGKHVYVPIYSQETHKPASKDEVDKVIPGITGDIVTPDEVEPTPEVAPTPETPEVEPTPEVTPTPENPEVTPTPETPEVEPTPETPEVTPTPETPEVEPTPEVTPTPENPEVTPTPETPSVPAEFTVRAKGPQIDSAFEDISSTVIPNEDIELPKGREGYEEQGDVEVIRDDIQTFKNDPIVEMVKQLVDETIEQPVLDEEGNPTYDEEGNPITETVTIQVEKLVPVEREVPDSIRQTKVTRQVTKRFHGTQFQADPNLEFGATSIIQEGQNGELIVENTTITLDGVEQENTTQTVVDTPALDQIIAYGTKADSVVKEKKRKISKRDFGEVLVLDNSLSGSERVIEVEGKEEIIEHVYEFEIVNEEVLAERQLEHNIVQEGVTQRTRVSAEEMARVVGEGSVTPEVPTPEEPTPEEPTPEEPQPEKPTPEEPQPEEPQPEEPTPEEPTPEEPTPEKPTPEEPTPEEPTPEKPQPEDPVPGYHYLTGDDAFIPDVIDPSLIHDDMTIFDALKAQKKIYSAPKLEHENNKLIVHEKRRDITNEIKIIPPKYNLTIKQLRESNGGQNLEHNLYDYYPTIESYRYENGVRYVLSQTKYIPHIIQEAFNQYKIIDHNELNEEFGKLLNAERASKGLPPIKHTTNAKAMAANNEKTYDNGRHGYLRGYNYEKGEYYGAHSMSTGQTTNDFYVTKDLDGAWYSGENSAARSAKNIFYLTDAKAIARDFFEQWKNSPGHYAYMMKDVDYDRYDYGFDLNVKVGDFYFLSDYLSNGLAANFVIFQSFK